MTTQRLRQALTRPPRPRPRSHPRLLRAPPHLVLRLRIPGGAPSRKCVGGEEGDLRTEEEDGFHAPVGEEGAACPAVEDPHFVGGSL